MARNERRNEFALSDPSLANPYPPKSEAWGLIAILEGRQDFINLMPATASVIHCIVAGETNEMLEAVRELRASAEVAASESVND